LINQLKQRSANDYNKDISNACDLIILNKSDWMNLNILTDLSKKLRDEIKIY